MAGPVCPQKDCNTPVPSHVDRCVACGRDVGYPNVRIADSEAATVDGRYRKAVADATAKGLLLLARRLEAKLSASFAVMCRSWAVGAALLSSDTKVYSTFYGRIEGETDLPEDNEFDAGRESVDALLFPHYHRKIRFGALSLQDGGSFGYGDCAIILKENSICDRTSVFEENAYVFCTSRGIVAGTSIPAGHRASWNQRAKLGLAKLGPRLDDTMDDTAFQRLVLEGTDRSGDLIEVHVYGPIHRRSVAAVVGRQPVSDEDERIVKRLEKALRTEEVPFTLVP